MNIKPLLTHLLAIGVGIVAVLFWPKPSDRKDSSSSDLGGDVRRGLRGELDSASSRASKLPGKVSFKSMMERSFSAQDLQAWIESRKGDVKSHAEALVIAGMITKDADLVRQGIEMDPKNPQLLFIGSTLSSFSEEEKLEMSARLCEADPENALASCMHAAHLFDAGQTDAALKSFRDSSSKEIMNDYRLKTQLLTEDAYVASGLPLDGAKLKSAFDFELGYLGDLLGMSEKLDAVSATLSPEDSADLQAMQASMGYRIGEQTKSATMMDRLVGMSLEKRVLDGLPEDAQSPYEGMSVGQAKSAIQEERESLKQVIGDAGELWDQLLEQPDLAARYADRVRLLGEVEAAKWLIQMNQQAK